MNYIDFCGERLSELVLGTDGYGKKIDTKTVFDIMDFYIENGGNVIDTARSYTDGESERIVGSYIKERGIRNKVFISTKCSFPAENMHISRLSAEEIEADIDASLKALDVDTIDMLWLHRDDTSKGVRTVIDTLNNMVRKGKIRYFGASNWTYERIDKANGYAYESGGDGFAASQVHYNLATCANIWDDTLVLLDDEEKRNYSENQLPLFAYSAQAKGFFEKYSQGILSQKAKERYLTAESVRTYIKIKAEADKTGDTISHTAIKLLTASCDFDVFPIIGPSSVKQLAETLNIKEY